MNEQIKQLFDAESLDKFMEKAGFWIRRSDKSDEEIAEWVRCAYESPLTHRDDFLPIIILCQLAKNEGIFWRKSGHYLEVAAKTLADDDRYDPIKYLDRHAGELSKTGLETALTFESAYYRHKLSKNQVEEALMPVNEPEEIEEEAGKKTLFTFGRELITGFILGVLLMLIIFLGMKIFGGSEKKEENQNVSAGANVTSVEQMNAGTSLEDMQAGLTDASEEMTEALTEAPSDAAESSKETEKKKDKEKDKEKNKDNEKETEKATMATVYCKDPRVVVRTGPSQSHKVVASVLGNQTLRIKVGNVVKDDSGNDEYSWREVYLGEYAVGEHENVEIRNDVSADVMYYIEDSYIKITVD